MSAGRACRQQDLHDDLGRRRQDTYDFSNYTTALTVNLQPGGWTTASTTQLAYLGSGHYAAGNIANALLYNNNPASLIENAIGGTGNDVMTGNIADNHFTGGGGNDVFDGGSGNDSAIYSGLTSDYSWSRNANGSWTITDLRTGSLDGADTLWNLEFLQFSIRQWRSAPTPRRRHRS